MPTVDSPKAKLTLRYWKASLAWKNIGEWAKGWTQEGFINECRVLCNDNGRVGLLADCLLNDMVHDIERSPREQPGIVVSLQSETKTIGQTSVATITA